MHQTSLIATDAERRPIISVVAKRTFEVLPSGACELAARQAALFVKPKTDPVHGGVFHESDILPFKASTDFVVLAKAYGNGARHMQAGIKMGRYRWDYDVSGTRRCLRGYNGKIVFSEPEPFETLWLCYENAYGGVDTSLTPQRQPLLDRLGPPPGAYPRNPVGKGYVVHGDPTVLESLELPNVEHPSFRVTPDNLVAGSVERWWAQPLPWACDWFAKDWYPRASFYGALPEHLPIDDRGMVEVRSGWVEPYQVERFAKSELADSLDRRLADAASPAMVLPSLQGDETIQLRGMTPSGRLDVSLPSHRPRMHIRLDGRDHEVIPVPHRIVLGVEQRKVSIVWHGALPLSESQLRRYAVARGDAEQAFPNADVFIDGHRLQA